MCEKCFLDFGSPGIVNERTVQAAKLIEDLYSHPDGITGGYGHIVFDDWNYDCVSSCIEDAEKEAFSNNIDEECRQLSITALKYFDTLTEDEKISALAIHWGYLKNNKTS